MTATNNKPANKLAVMISEALHPTAEPLGKIIAITNQKGGVGKTSTSFNFAHFLNELGYRVLAVDFDGQGNFTDLFFDQDVLTQYVHTQALNLFSEGGVDDFMPLSHPSGIDVLATKRNSHALNEIDTRDTSVFQIAYTNLSKIIGRYDFVLIDTPPAPGVRTTMACAFADYIFAPVLVDTFAESALQGVLSSIDNINSILGTEAKLSGILINQLTIDGTVESKKQHEELSAQIGDVLIPTAIRRSKAFSRAQRLGTPVWHLNSSGAERTTRDETRNAYGEMALRIDVVDPNRVKNFNYVSRAVRQARNVSEAGI